MKRRSNRQTKPSKNTYGNKKRSGNMLYGFNPHRLYKGQYKDLIITT